MSNTATPLETPVESAEVKVFQSLSPLIRDIAKDRLALHSKANEGIILAELSQNRASTQNVLAHWMAIILVSGNDLKLTLKVHYFLEEAKAFGAKAGATSDVAENAERLAHDFIKEYCNLTAGKLKRVFEDQKLNIGISLPLITRGFDEVFAARPNSITSFEDAWEFKLDDHSIVCTSHLDILGPKALLELSTAGAFAVNQQAEAEDEGDVEFL